MRLNKLAIACALLSCAATVTVLHVLRNRQEGAYWWFREQNDGMRYEAYQRRQAARPQTTAAQPTTESSAPVSATPRPPLSTGEQYGYHNSGFATPEAAMQTFVWACERADVETLTGMFHMEEQERERAERFFSSLPEEVRTQWKSTNELAAHLQILSAMANSFPPADVLAAAPVEMPTEDQATCGIVHRVSFRRLGAQWRCELKSAELERLYQEATRTLGAP